MVRKRFCSVAVASVRPGIISWRIEVRLGRAAKKATDNYSRTPAVCSAEGEQGGDIVVAPGFICQSDEFFGSFSRRVGLSDGRVDLLLVEH